VVISHKGESILDLHHEQEGRNSVELGRWLDSIDDPNVTVVGIGIAKLLPIVAVEHLRCKGASDKPIFAKINALSVCDPVSVILGTAGKTAEPFSKPYVDYESVLKYLSLERWLGRSNAGAMARVAHDLDCLTTQAAA
jgi:hypothetical protein